MIGRIYTGNPVRDAEIYQELLEEAQAKRDFIECDICHGPIFRADDDYHGDYVWELDDKNICEDCIDGYLKEHKKELT